jgi:hypothetical protein
MVCYKHGPKKYLDPALKTICVSSSGTDNRNLCTYGTHQPYNPCDDENVDVWDYDGVAIYVYPVTIRCAMTCLRERNLSA